VETSFLHTAITAATQGGPANMIGPLDKPHEFVFVPDVGPVVARMIDLGCRAPDRPGRSLSPYQETAGYPPYRSASNWYAFERMATSVTASPTAPAVMNTSAMPRPIPVPNQPPMR
jgi:hypothetical protein